MKCSYHQTSIASARCSSCRRSICPACDHRIKGSPYCQDCIVAGIEMLRRHESGGIDPRSSSRTEEKSPLIALLLGLVPGLGAAYNGQNVKALVHFVVTVGLWTLADIFHSTLEAALAMTGVAFYLYTLYDAFASAQRQRAGVNLQVEDERIKLFLRHRTNVCGGLLVCIGALAILNAVFPHHLYRLWPLLLILAGLYLLRGYYRGQHERLTKPAYPTPPPSVIPSSYDRSTSDFAGAEGRYER
jgi:TM2 domain-containing membrane protein YozV